MSTDDSRAQGAARNLGRLVVRSERDGETHVVELLGELDLAGAPVLDEELARVEAGDASSILVDLRGLEFIDSTGLRLLVMAADRCKESGRLALLRGPDQVHRVFVLTDLVSRLPFSDL